MFFHINLTFLVIESIAVAKEQNKTKTYTPKRKKGEPNGKFGSPKTYKYSIRFVKVTHYQFISFECDIPEVNTDNNY